MSKKKLITVWLTTSLIMIIGFVIGRIFVHLTTIKVSEDNIAYVVPAGHANDASELSLTPIHKEIPVASNKQAIISQLRELLKTAKNDKLKISLAGAKHSMGGHTIYPNGIVINMLPNNHMQLDVDSNTLKIGSGALWEDALRYLDKHGKSISCMQAFSSFSVGGSISVNGHGWQKNTAPISSSVISFTLMQHDGSIVICSREQNSELFSLVLGGYGLFGIILDVTLEVTENVALTPYAKRLDTKDYLNYYKKMVTNNPNANLAFGRLRISDKKFLEQATITYFEVVNKTLPSMPIDENIKMKRLVFRGSVNNEYGKRLRWDLENIMNGITEQGIYSRNEILSADPKLIENKDSYSTDILHEYFIPERRFYQYLKEIKPILQDTGVDLLNITIRAVNKDNDTFLNYAREDVFGFVYLFNQKKTDADEHSMKELTKKLVTVAIKNEGTYYLPYRLHVDKEAMRQSYPQADKFFDLKQKYDPNEIFNNKFYLHYK